MVIAKHISPADVHLYAVDAGSNALLPLALLPHTGAVVTRDQTERITRLTTLLKTMIADRQQQLAVGGFANLEEQRRGSAVAHRLPYVIFMLDAWDVFHQTYENVDSGELIQAVTQIAQEGPGVGITCIVTGNRTLMMGRISNLFPDKLTLRMTNPSDYIDIGMPLRSAPSSVVSGRAFSSHNVTETQVALVAADPSGQAQVEALQLAAQQAEQHWQSLPTEARPEHVDVLPIKFDLSEMGTVPLVDDGPHALPIMVGGDTLSLYCLDSIDHGPGFLVAGPRRSGRSTVLKMLALFALHKGWSVLGITMRQSALHSLAHDQNLIGILDGNTVDKETLEAALKQLTEENNPSLVLVDDMERMAHEGWLSESLAAHLDAIRDTGSALAGAATSGETNAYRGIMAALKKAHSGVLLSPQVLGDREPFGTTIPKSALGLTLPPGAGFPVRTGAAIRAQVVYPDIPVPI